MIRDGSYACKFADYLNMKSRMGEFKVPSESAPVLEQGRFSCRQLFQKELTPSDVGKLNRLVIPKKNALKYFPHISDAEVEKGGVVDEVRLIFYDRLMRPWKFRYCYWNTCQSFVFTRGWNKFVKEKELKAKDVAIFSLCQCWNGINQVSAFYMIDVICYNRVESTSVVVEPIMKNAETLLEFVANDVVGDVKKEFEDWAQILDPPRQNSEDIFEAIGAKKKGSRLFGVQII